MFTTATPTHEGQRKLDDIIFPASLSEIKQFSGGDLSAYCLRHGLYQIITKELVDFCVEVIQGRIAIEIGSGRGCLGKALDIPRTDSHLVTSRPDVAAMYKAIGERTDPLPQEVEKLNARQAVKKHRPQVVIAAWVTERGNTPGKTSPYGVEEDWLLDQVETYVLIGNGRVHGNKHILLRPHQVMHKGAEWLVSRSAAQSENAIWVWDRQGV